MNLLRWQRPGLSYWPALGPLSTLRDEIDRLFESPLTELARTSQLFSSGTPALDMHEDKDHIVVKVELPGLKKEDLEVGLHDGNLSISGERKREAQFENAEVYRTERFFGRFERTVSLPVPVDGDKIKAQYQDGVLTITLPKSQEVKPRQIDVQVN